MSGIPLIICAAGVGSRVFPASWGLCKELFPIDNRPALHHALEEVLNSGIEDIYCLISKHKESIKRYLEYNELQKEIPLNEKEKERLIILHELNKKFKYCFCYQENPLGVGNALLSAFKHIDLRSNYVGVLYPDDIYEDKSHGLSTIVNISKKFDGSCVALEEVHRQKVSMYGVIDVEKQIDEYVYKISKIVEKPSLEEAPSNLSIVGRYILHKDLFLYLEKQYTERPCSIKAMNEMIKDGYDFYGSIIPSKRFDIGSIKGWQNTVYHFSNI